MGPTYFPCIHVCFADSCTWPSQNAVHPGISSGALPPTDEHLYGTSIMLYDQPRSLTINVLPTR